MGVARPRLIIVEGAQGAGKTTTTNLLREYIPYSVLIRSTGLKEDDKDKIYKYFDKLYNFFLETKDIGVSYILDRAHFSEEAYCNLGYKGYTFSDYTEKLNNLLVELSNYYDVLIVILTASLEEYTKRLQRDKAQYKNISFSGEKSMEQELEYLRVVDLFRTNIRKTNVRYIKFLVIDTIVKKPKEIAEFIKNN